MLPTTEEMEISAALEVLQKEMEKKKVEEAEKNEDRDEMDDDIGTSATDQDEDEDMIGGEGQPQAPMKVDDALKILVKNATEEFGFAPRDVYDGVFKLSETKMDHVNELGRFDYGKLRKVVETFTAERGLVCEQSHRVVVVFPRPPEGLHFERWGIDFKSIRIGEKMIELMLLLEDKNLREMYRYLHRVDSSDLAGRFFESIAHHIFSDGWGSGPPPQPIRMVSNDFVPPVFSIDPASSTPDTTLLFNPLRADARSVMRVDFTDSQLSGVTLDNDIYYVPTAANNPLFDSFTIDSDHSLDNVVISIFQITISKRHRGSAKGYSHIRKIMGHVRRLLKEKKSKATVKVGYFLVCPDDRSRREWQMPVGWQKSAKINDHRGDGFCIRVPVSGHRGTLCLFAPDFATELNHDWI